MGISRCAGDLTAFFRFELAHVGEGVRFDVEMNAGAGLANVVLVNAPYTVVYRPRWHRVLHSNGR